MIISHERLKKKKKKERKKDTAAQSTFWVWNQIIIFFNMYERIRDEQWLLIPTMKKHNLYILTGFITVNKPVA